MKKQFYFLVLILMACFARTANAQVQVDARVDSGTIKIGDQTQLHLSVRQPAGQKVNFPQLADTINAKVLLVGASKLDTIKDKNDPKTLIVSQSYTITSFDAGTYTIPPFDFGSSAGVLKTAPFNLTVQTMKVDTTKAIYDIKQPIAVSYTWLDWIRDHFLLLYSIFFALTVLIVIIHYVRNRKKKVVVVLEAPKPVIPLHVTVLGRLENLRTQKMWQQGNIKGYHSELSDIMRDYLENRYVIKTHEKTTAEIFASMKFLDIADNDRNMLRLILLLADMVKFAKENPLPNENEQSMDNAIAFVNNTKQVNAPVAPAEGGAANV